MNINSKLVSGLIGFVVLIWTNGVVAQPSIKVLSIGSSGFVPAYPGFPYSYITGCVAGASGGIFKHPITSLPRRINN